MNKLQKTAKGLDRFFAFTQKLTIAGCVIGGIGVFLAWYLWLGDPSIWKMAYTSLRFGGITFTVDNSIAPADNAYTLYLAMGTILSIAQLPVLYMTFGAIRGILGLMIEGTPFHEHIVYYLKKLGWLVIANGIIGIVAGFILQGNFLQQYDLGALFLSDKITQVTTGFSIDLTFLIYAVILFLLAEVFRYGMELQQLSDETL